MQKSINQTREEFLKIGTEKAEREGGLNSMTDGGHLTATHDDNDVAELATSSSRAAQ